MPPPIITAPIAAHDPSAAAAALPGLSARRVVVVVANAPAGTPIPARHARVDIRRAGRLADGPAHEPDAPAADAREHVAVQ